MRLGLYQGQGVSGELSAMNMIAIGVRLLLFLCMTGSWMHKLPLLLLLLRRAWSHCGGRCRFAFRGRLELVMVLKSKECCRHVMSGWNLESFQQLGGDPAGR